MCADYDWPFIWPTIRKSLFLIGICLAATRRVILKNFALKINFIIIISPFRSTAGQKPLLLTSNRFVPTLPESILCLWIFLFPLSRVSSTKFFFINTDYPQMSHDFQYCQLFHYASKCGIWETTSVPCFLSWCCVVLITCNLFLSIPNTRMSSLVLARDILLMV